MRLDSLRRLALSAGALLLAHAAAHADDELRFDRDVRPLLADRCFACHGPDEHDRRGGLRLDRADGEDGAYVASEPGDLTRSELWARVSSEDPDERMPPPESGKEPFDAEELALLARWIEGGAGYQDHWAFVAPAVSEEPAVRAGDWPRRALDRYVLRGIEQAELEPRPEAEPRTLVRRLHLDLIGLPPTREEIASFLTDYEADPEAAYARRVDALLERPQYGEHQARTWLDLVRFADTNGVHHDHYRELSPYRDWVIRAFNDNLPFDQFATWQLAGDLLEDPTDDQLIASGYNRLHRIIDSGTMLPEESLSNNVRDRVEAFGTVFLGLTTGCAVCHDHKYDPLTQRDFYALSAFFNNFDGAPETNSGHSDKMRGLQPPYIEFPTEEQAAELERLDGALETARAEHQRLRSEQQAASEEAERQRLQTATQEAQQRVNALQQERNGVLRWVDAAMVMRERAQVRPAYVLVRGDYQTPGAEVGRATPAFLPGLEVAGERPSRLDLARWLLREDHPLTARVAVNRLWQQVFGVGLVKTSEDLGAQGEWPSHPELLDRLALDFIASGWDVKAMLREFVLSSTYRQSSAAAPEDYARDPENRLLARGARYRLDAEVIRDQLLATSGLLNPRMYGRSVKPPQPEGVWSAVTLPSSYPKVYRADEGEDIVRRSLYTFWKRAMPPVQMSILNAPARESCVARRERTNTPLQALLLLNEPQYLRAARALAQAALEAEPLDAEERAAWIVETVTSQRPGAAALEQLLGLARELEALYADAPELARQLCALEAEADAASSAEWAAWTMLASSVYNLDQAKTRE